MQYRELIIDGLKIALLESAGAGTPLVMAHGNSTGAEIFPDLLAGEIGRRRKMIAVDFPGHGRSDRADDPQRRYSIPAFGETLDKVVEALGLGEYILMGHSLGGHAVMESLSSLAAAKAALLISAPPVSLETLGEAFLPDPTAGAIFKAELSNRETELFARCLADETLVSAESLANIRKAIRTADPVFRTTLGASLFSGNIRNEREALERHNVPVALAFGNRDPFTNPAFYGRMQSRNLWRGEPVCFAKAGHSPQAESPEEFGRFLSAFLAEFP